MGPEAPVRNKRRMDQHAHCHDRTGDWPSLWRVGSEPGCRGTPIPQGSCGMEPLTRSLSRGKDDPPGDDHGGRQGRRGKVARDVAATTTARITAERLHKVMRRW